MAAVEVRWSRGRGAAWGWQMAVRREPTGRFRVSNGGECARGTKGLLSDEEPWRRSGTARWTLSCPSCMSLMMAPCSVARDVWSDFVRGLPLGRRRSRFWSCKQISHP